MAIVKRAVVGQIEITEIGIVQVKLQKQFVEDGRVVMQEPHRMALEPGVQLEDLAAAVNAHLEAMGYPAVEDHEIARVARFAGLAHTPEVVAAFGEIRAARAALAEAHTKHRDANGAPAATTAALDAIAAAEASIEASTRNAVETVRAPAGRAKK